MRRWHLERHITYRNWDNYRRFVHRDEPVRSGHPRQDQPGRFRKRDAWDCGRSKCHLCHQDKLLRRPRRSELLADLRLREGLADVSQAPPAALGHT